MALTDDLERLCEGAIDAALALTDEGTIAFANARAEALLGADRGALAGRPLADFMGDADARLRAATSEPPATPAQALVLPLRGKLQPVACVFQRDVLPGHHRVVLRADDATEGAPDALLHAAFDGSTSAIAVFDVTSTGDVRLRRANPAAHRSGLLARADAGTPLEHALVPPMPEGVTAALREATRTRQPSSYEEFVELDGVETWWLTTVTPVVHGGRVASLVVSSLALDFLRATEDALQRSEAHFRTLIECAPDAVFVFVERRVVYVNPAASLLLDLPPKKLLGMTVDELTLDAPERPRPGGGARTAQYRLRRSDAREVLVEAVTLPITHEGRPAMLALARDLTERQKLAERALHAEKMIAVGTLAAGLAHEINNPLAYIVGNLAFALEGFDGKVPLDHRETSEALREAQIGAEKVSRIVAEMQAFVRPDSDAPTAIELAPVVESSVRLVETRVRQRARLAVVLDRAPRVVCDQSRLRRAIANLLLNAAQAVDGADGEPEIVVRLGTEPDGRAHVAVRDTGCGIPDEHRPRLFEPFFTTQPRGVGLGLFFAHNVVRGAGGEIVVTSRPNEGSTFTMLLPAADGAQGASTLPRVLVVDDEPLVGSIVRRLLVGAFDVTAMTSAKDALAALDGGASFDAVLCDVTMPEMSGIAFFRELEARHAELAKRLVFLTGGAHTREAREFFASGEVVPVRKPFDREQLREAVTSAIARA